MMSYTRLTNKGANLEKKQFIGVNYSGYVAYEIDEEALDLVIKAINRLAELEDKIEQGTLIELKDRKPLMWGKDGDTIHCQHCGKDLMGAFDGETEIIQCTKCGGFVYGSVAEDYNESKLQELQE